MPVEQGAQTLLLVIRGDSWRKHARNTCKCINTTGTLGTLVCFAHCSSFQMIAFYRHVSIFHVLCVSDLHTFFKNFMAFRVVVSFVRQAFRKMVLLKINCRDYERAQFIDASDSI